MAMDYSGLVSFRDKLARISDQNEKDQFLDGCLKELTGRFLSDVKPLTPIGIYPSGSGRTGGTLRRGWTGGTDADPFQYASGMPVKKSGTMHTIEITNPIEYASYVEYGHRQTPGRYVPALGKRLVLGWVDGKLMMNKSTNRLKQYAPSVLNRRVDEYLRRLNG